MYDNVLDGLTHLFPDDPSITTTRGADYVKFTQPFIDSTLISPALFDKQKMLFSHTVTVFDDGTYKEIDEIRKSGASLTGASVASKRGTLNMRGFTLGLGKDNITGQVGPVMQKWDTEIIKGPVRAYMETTGLKKRPAMWWTPKRIIIAIAVCFAVIWIPILIALLG